MKSRSARFSGLFLSAALLVNGACNMPIPFFGQKTEIDHCDPVANYFENGQHYIGADFVKEDGTIDYEKYFKARKIESSPCDPLNRPGDDEPSLQPNIAPSTKPGTGTTAEKKVVPTDPDAPRNTPQPIAPTDPGDPVN